MIPLMQGLRLANYIGGGWRSSGASDYVEVRNPATTEPLALVPFSTRDDVDAAVAAAQAVRDDWRRMPATERVQYLFQLKRAIESRFGDISRLITEECGKTLAESEAELTRAVENIEVACGIPSLMMGRVLEDVASGIDEAFIRQPVGVVAAITPFNFPAMVPLWFLPYAIACGNCFILKPSERVPLAMHLVYELLDGIGLPPGVVALVNGGKDAVDAIVEHPGIRAVSFVGSTPVARYVYSRSAANGKRVQCQGGARNVLVVLSDADLEMTTRIAADSAFGCAGQRCLAASVAVAVGEAAGEFGDRIARTAAARKVGYGLDAGVEMGPVITPESKERIERLVTSGREAGARLLVDGRGLRPAGYGTGNFVGPTVVEGAPPDSDLARTEIFGPVLSLVHARDLDAAIALVNRSAFGNMACLFTSSGAAARKFRYEVQAGNVGINVGVAAPMAFFPFSGSKQSFFGDLHAQGPDAIDFYTEKKVVVERWPGEWSRTF
jgi:malonate-semialdehyde dehydrogenase (acetylating)/methylmalonate-semialdehyde dehydrogenase